MSNLILHVYDVLSAHLKDQYAGLAMGITFGTKLHISAALQEQMRIIGASHLLVLSGGNIGMLGEFLEQVIFFIPNKVRSALLIVFITMFVLAISIQGSVMRATIMYIVPKLGDILGRRSHKMYILFLTFFAMLAWDINYLNDISFILSFGALLGIFMFELRSPLDKKASQKNTLEQMIMRIHRQVHISVSAQTLVLPLIFYYFNSVALLGVVSTLMIGVVVAPIMFCTIGLLITSFLPLPFAMAPFVFSLHYLLMYVEFLASSLSSLRLLYIQY